MPNPALDFCVYLESAMQAFVISFCLAIVMLTVSKQASSLIKLNQPATSVTYQLTLPESTEAGAEDSTEIEDDDDSAREHSRLTHSFLPGGIDGKHFFDHPSLEQTCMQVATPPPKR